MRITRTVSVTVFQWWRPPWGGKFGIDDLPGQLRQPTAVRQALRPPELHLSGHFDQERAFLLHEVPKDIQSIQTRIQQEQQPAAGAVRQNRSHQIAFARAFAGVGGKDHLEQPSRCHGEERHQPHLGKGGRAFRAWGLPNSVRFGSVSGMVPVVPSKITLLHP